MASLGGQALVPCERLRGLVSICAVGQGWEVVARATCVQSSTREIFMQCYAADFKVLKG